MSRVHPSLLPFVSRLEGRSTLRRDEREALLSLPCALVQVQANHDFVGLGEITHHACLVVDGLVGRFGQSRGGARQISALYIAGDMPDLHSLVLPKADSALQALTPSTVLRVPHAALHQLIEHFPTIAKALWRDCTVDAMIAAEWIANVGRRDARSRLAHLFCEMEQRYAQIGAAHGGHFDFPVTQSQLADITALTPVHVNRMLQGLKQENVLTISRQRVTIIDRGALEQLAEFDSNYLHLADTTIDLAA